jgi:glutathione-regulated potassium-efflux system ancillary protein KefC
LELFGLRPDESLRELSQVGILLLLFAIGLKLDVRSLATRPVFGTALVHMALSVGFFMAVVLGLATVGLGLFEDVDLQAAGLIAFALSFSSTVFAVKVLEERDDMATVYGRMAVGVLIVQDIAAVVFITLSGGEWPSPWAFALFALIPLRPLVARALEWCGHGELLVLAGLAAALGAAALFDYVGLKADLGALAAGVICGGHRKSSELASSLLGLKDVFLVGFFLTVGLTGLPTPEMVGVALVLALLLPLKAGLFFFLLTRFGLRARSGVLAGAGLTTYSEFGLIVAAVGVSKGWLPTPWMVTLAIAAGVSFILGAALNSRAFGFYRARRALLLRLERPERLPDEEQVDVSWASALVFGMGRIGAPAYDEIKKVLGTNVAGFDVDRTRVDEHQAEGRRVFVASATDADFWERLHIERERVQLVLLAMSSNEENRIAIEQLRAEGYEGTIAATARYDDEVAGLNDVGADVVFRSFADAGPAFARQALDFGALDFGAL